MHHRKTTIIRDESDQVRFETEYATSEQRYAHGKKLRSCNPVESHSAWRPSADRPDVISLIHESNQNRLADLIPIRHRRMLRNPFSFFRGSAAVMAYDLSGTAQSGITIPICGDCHLSNFGLFATPERNLIFDLNDFDETHPAPFEWDLKRLAASFYIVGKTKGFSSNDCKKVVRSCVSTYHRAIREFSTMKILDIWYAKLRVDDLIALSPDEKTKKQCEKMAKKARNNISELVFPKVAQKINGKIRFVDHPPLLSHALPEFRIEESLLEAFTNYYASLSPDHKILLNRYKIEDMALKVVGVGSVGTRCGIILLIGENHDPLILQVKEAQRSVLEPYTAPSGYENQGERVVQGQRLLQSASDTFLGWSTDNTTNTHYYLRQLRDMKYSFDVESYSPMGLSHYANICGWTLARAHARAGDAALISGYMGKSDQFDKAMVSFARDYTDQNALDYQRFVEAEKTGEIIADPNPDV